MGSEGDGGWSRGHLRCLNRVQTLKFRASSREFYSSSWGFRLSELTFPPASQNSHLLDELGLQLFVSESKNAKLNLKKYISGAKYYKKAIIISLSLHGASMVIKVCNFVP